MFGAHPCGDALPAGRVRATCTKTGRSSLHPSKGKLDRSRLPGGVFGVHHGKAARQCKAAACCTARAPLPLVAALFLLTWALIVSCAVEAHHVLAVDLGVEWVKAATLGGGSGASINPAIVLNDQANRKSPQCIAFRFLPYDTDDILQKVERIFFEQALSLEPRFPEQVVCGSSLLAGRGVWRDVVAVNGTGATGKEAGQDALLPDDTASLTYAVVPHASRDKLAVHIVGGRDKKSVLKFSAEELVGMFFAYLKRTAERGLDGEPLRHLVLTVSTRASVAQRQTFVDAAAVAGLRTVRLVHGITAAAVQLAYLNAEQLFAPVREKSSKYVMVYDMGSRVTEVAVYEFAQFRQHPGTITLLAAVVNDTLGGRAFDQCIARYIERELFPKANPKAIEPVLALSTPAARKAAASLLRAVKSARERLSVNQEAPVVVQGIHESDGGDFTTTISRARFAQECAHLFDEAVRLRDAAIAQTKGAVPSVRNLTRFEVIGGTTRMPKLLERLSDGYGRAVDRTLNSDEAAVVGAAYMGAARAGIPVRGFHVVEPLMNDVYFSLTPPLQDLGAAGTPPRRDTRQLLFAKARTLVPEVKSLRLKNRTADFTLTLEDHGGRFARSTLIYGVNDSIMTAQFLPRRRRVGGGAARGRHERLSLEYMEVVVEVTVAESGIPFVSNAYLRVTYEKRTVAVKKDQTSPGNMTQNESVATSSAGENATHAAAPEESQKHPDLRKPDEEAEEVEAGRLQQEREEEEAEDRWEDAPESGAEMEDEEEEEEEEGEKQGAAKDKREGDQTREKDNNTGDDAVPGVGNPSNAKETVTRVVRGFPLRFALAPFSAGVNLNKMEATAARERLDAFQRIDDARLMRSAIRNDLETLIVHYKSLDAWDKAPVGDAGEANWREVVKEVAQWLDDAGENVEIAELQRQQQRVKELKIGETATG
ncbi:putative heat shock protein 70 (hsp70) [Trypanosoma rangeli]|uniref:Putative heat shock protein 70 (Hsp70) n=1 Tax=Trypanosoma rangeli TaxID=5698 RepID=A0A422NGS3_TRYRA|nr:putative heat shock protein 70 (hsp70) [Trypanosoma rangeli]RNF04680.1 putative heat shock protein 70 (hsp70) [Trypanosoma rangeli]|eukprot:RNF04680.1 putative heat shock protein 70 (hsp70) [Trypanosoma rangeli]